MKRNNGITLISLVITIVVLIILAGVAINLTLGENGIFTKAQYAKEQYEMAAVREKINLAMLGIQTEEINNGELTLDTMLTRLQEKLPGITIEKDGEILKGTLDGYDFVIGGNFEVIIEGYNPEAGNDDTEEEEETPTTYTVTLNGANITSNGASQVNKNAEYVAKLVSTTGYYITNVEVTMNGSTLTKDIDYTYTNGDLRIPNVNGNIEVKGTTIVKPSGEYVNYEIDLNDDGDITNDWMIFYKEEDTASLYNGATYIIPSYYVPASKIITSLTNAEMSLYSGTYRVKWSSEPTSFVKNDKYDIVKNVFMYDYTGEANTNAYAVSRLLNTDYWKDDFLTKELQEKGGMAIGGPTAKMWCASWNKTYTTTPIEASIPKDGTGYQVNGSASLRLNSYEGYNTYAPNVYFVTNNQGSDGTNGYWLTAPSSDATGSLMIVAYDGYLGGNGYSNSGLGVRPLVYLPASIILTPDATTPNLWNINY